MRLDDLGPITLLAFRVRPGYIPSVAGTRAPCSVCAAPCWVALSSPAYTRLLCEVCAPAIFDAAPEPPKFFVTGRQLIDALTTLRRKPH